ncbi:alpha/beta hydrolase [Lutimonas sp.]|uniref:alpha/beta hydrolase n=1 Tax=Lutimonas sp. TaxID=1872403 RepID=UPI003D9B747A
MTRKPFEFTTCGLKLSGQSYDTKNPKGVILLIHGMGEYARRYERSVIPVLLKNSMAVVSYDQFGHGDTEGKRGHHPGYNCILDALEEVLSKAKSLYPEVPVFLYGHSMGGNVVINYALRRPTGLSGLIATSPFLRLAFSPPKWKMTFGKIIDKIYPSLTMPNELDLQALSKDQDEIEAYASDPMVHDKVSTRFSLEFMEKGAWAMEHAATLHIPMLLVHGTKDRITSHEASKEFAEKGGKNCELHLIENGFHELHHDLEKQLLFDTICDWLKKQITIT